MSDVSISPLVIREERELEGVPLLRILSHDVILELRLICLGV